MPKRSRAFSATRSDDEHARVYSRLGRWGGHHAGGAERQRVKREREETEAAPAAAQGEHLGVALDLALNM